MATKKATTASPTTGDQGKIVEERLSLACEASDEIEILVGMLRREVERDSDGLELILRSTLRRIKDLNSVILSTLGGDDNRKTAEMREVVFGHEALGVAS